MQPVEFSVHYLDELNLGRYNNDLWLMLQEIKYLYTW